MAMNWLEPIDQYCERVDASLWAEPLNALSNAAFLVAAWCLWRHYSRSGQKDRWAVLLCGMVAVVGLGSLGFHTFANRVSMLGDVIPILLFVLLYIGVGFFRLAGFGRRGLLGVYVVFFTLAALMKQLSPGYSFNGSIAYAPCLLVLVGLAVMCQVRKHHAAKHMLVSAGVFFVALVFRSVDMAWCEGLPLGTHFLWHCLNGVLLYRLGRSITLKN